MIRYATGADNASRELSDQAKADLGIEIQYTTSLTSDDLVKRAVTQPTSFDLLDSEYWMLKKIVPSGNLRGMDVSKVKDYDKIVPIFTKGELPDGNKISRIGTAPIKVSYLTGATSDKFAKEPTGFMTLIPTVYNADTLGIRPDLIKRPISSWAELLNPEFKGKAAILNIPSIGIMDAAMVCQAPGQDQIRRHGQHDQGRDRQDHGDHDRGQAGRSVPRLLEGVRRERQPDGLGRGGDPVDVVAGGHRGPRRASPASTSPSRKAIGRGPAGSASQPLNGNKLDACYEYINWYCPAGPARSSTARATTSAVLETAKGPDGALGVGLLDGGQARRQAEWSARPARRSPRPARSATAAPTGSAWATSRSGTR